MILRKDNSIPLIVGQTYQLGNDQSGNWVKIISIENGMVHAVGVELTIADMHVPVWKFDDLLATPEQLDTPYFLTNEADINLLYPDGTGILINWEPMPDSHLFIFTLADGTPLTTHDSIQLLVQEETL